MTDGLLLESVKLETGVFSTSLPTLVTAVPAEVVGVVDTVVRCAAVDVTLAVLETTLEVLTARVGIFFRISSFAFHPSCKITFISFIIQPYVSLKVTKHRILLALFMMFTLRAKLIFSQTVNLQITSEPILSDALYFDFVMIF